MQYLDILAQNWYIPVIAVIAAYLIGSINPAIIITRLFSHRDIREVGSGNAGATNVLRSQGKLAAALTALCDIGKGVLGAWLGGWMFTAFCGNGATSEQLEWLRFTGYCLAGLAAELGHLFPVYFGFRGGKGVLVSLGLLLVLDWRVGVLAVVVFIVFTALTKMVSIGSMAASISAIGLVYVFLGLVRGLERPTLITCLGLVTIAALLILIKHMANIRRIARGEENKLSFSKKNKTSDRD